MSKAPAFQLYAKDWITGTALMTHAERGAYMDMICQQWETGPFKDDPETLRKAMRATPAEFKRWWPALESRFPLNAEGLRANLKIEKVRAVQAARAVAGQRGGQQTASNVGSKTSANREANGPAKGHPASASAVASPENDSSVSASRSLPRGPEKPFARAKEMPGLERRRTSGQGMAPIAALLPKAPAA